MRCILCFVLALFIPVISAFSDCSSYDFPCEDGGCVDSGLWCDTHEDCDDGSDEKYCKRNFLFNKDPNKCPPEYFKCGNGPCIPIVGVCDGYGHCEDASDEQNCEILDSFVTNSSTTTFAYTSPSSETKTTTAAIPVTTTTTAAARTSTETMRATTHYIPANVSLPVFLSDSSETLQHSVQVVHSELQPSDYYHQREKARDWLLSQRKSDFGWGSETPRAITALKLSDVSRSSKNESDLLMVKQLEVQLSLDIARNGTKAMQLADLALYINALSASCKDTKNFYGENLVRTLRNSVDAAQRSGTFVNPSVYLTLCLNNATTYEDLSKTHKIFSNRNNALGRMDIQALAFSTSTCIHRKTNYLSDSLYESIKQQFLQRVNSGGFPGNVYEAALIFQALQEIKYNLPGLLEFILRQQEEDGSFGDILATYLVLPVLAGRSFLKMNEHCGQRFSSDPAPIEVLKNAKRQKIYCSYTLNYGDPPEITQTIQMKVAEGINFLDVMRLAQEISPKYRFMLDGNGDTPVVYSIGGIPNDAEKGTFWTLHMASNRAAKEAGSFAPYSGNIKQLIPRNGDEFVFWYRSI